MEGGDLWLQRVRAVVERYRRQGKRVSADLAEEMQKAAATGRGDIIRVLLEGGADPHGRSKDGNTALHWASRNGHVEVVRILLQAGAKPDIQDGTGNTPLHWASRNGHI